MLDFDEKSNMHRCMRDSNGGWAYAWRRVRDPLPDIFAPTRSSSSGDPSGECPRDEERIIRKKIRQRVVPTVDGSLELTTRRNPIVNIL